MAIISVEPVKQRTRCGSSPKATQSYRGGQLKELKFAKQTGSVYGDVEIILGDAYHGNLIAKTHAGVEAIRIPATLIQGELKDCSPRMKALLKINATRTLTAVELLTIEELQIDVAAALARAFEGPNR